MPALSVIEGQERSILGSVYQLPAKWHTRTHCDLLVTTHPPGRSRLATSPSENVREGCGRSSGRAQPHLSKWQCRVRYLNIQLEDKRGVTRKKIWKRWKLSTYNFREKEENLLTRPDCGHGTPTGKSLLFKRSFLYNFFKYLNHLILFSFY